MDLPGKFIEYIHKKGLFQANDRLLLAVSGGVDSTVLCDLCEAAGFDFVIAHCNFQLRADESTRDETFVRELAKKYGVEIKVKSFDTAGYAAEKKVSTQVAARELRYQWFEELLAEGADGNHLQWVVTAHHATDNVETLLINFFKGTGISGLRGMLPRRGRVARPLLFATKEELLEYANANHIAFVEDSSNLSDKYTRNYFRNRLIPAVKEVFPQAEQNLLHNIGRFGDIERLYEQAIDQHKKRLIEIKGEAVYIPVLKLEKSEPLPTILYEIIKDFGFGPQQLGDAVKLLQSESGKYIQSATHRILRNRKWLIISPIGTKAAQVIPVEEGDSAVHFPAGSVNLETLGASQLKLTPDADIACLDAAAIRFPLLLRRWKQGDYFYPLGMKKKKKLSRFFIDQKLSLNEKENTWVLESNKKIIWIVGMRIDERCKVTGHTTTVLRLRFKRS